MTDLTEMWEALARYQPYADRHGFGAEWLRMTTKRTKDAALDAAWASRVTVFAARAARAARAAAWAMHVTATKSVEWERNSAVWVQRAINDIRTAIKREEQT
jgi:hypothetical protein